jgi:hypothetical protein
MQVSAVSQNTNVASSFRMPERREVGPDRDGDRDDAGSVKSTPPQGAGKLLDVTA